MPLEALIERWLRDDSRGLCEEMHREFNRFFAEGDPEDRWFLPVRKT